MIRCLRLFVAVFASAALLAPAEAARVGVMSNNYAAATAFDFASRIPGHAFSPIDVSGTVPSLQDLLTAYDVILLFEDSPTTNLFAGATVVGNTVASFAAAGRPVVIGSFYDQDRSDNRAFAPHGWGALEALDPNTTDGVGTSYAARTLNAATLVPHPLTAGVASLFASAGTGFAGGNEAKPGTTVVAWWTQPNAHGAPDPAIAFRTTGAACVIQVGIAPNYAVYGTLNAAYGGDFYRVWQNAFDFAAGKCRAPVIPGDPGQIARGWANRAELDLWRTAFPFAIILDDTFIQSGYGPALLLETAADGSITVR
jgi:hypothetical protein